MKTVKITITTYGSNADPEFDIYDNVDPGVVRCANVSLADLIAGFDCDQIDDNATQVILVGHGGVCDTTLPLDITECTTTTTTTVAPTTTTTTTIPPTTTTTTTDEEPTTTTTSTTQGITDHLFFGHSLNEGTYTFTLDASPAVSQEISATINVDIWEVQGVTPHADTPWIMSFTILNGQTTPVATIDKTPADPCVWTVADVTVTAMSPDIADVTYSGTVIYP